MTNRRTSSYLLELPPTETRRMAHAQADKLIADLPVAVDASGVATGRAFVRFRCSDDEQALRIAAQTAGTAEWKLSVGYGVHQREIVRENQR